MKKPNFRAMNPKALQAYVLAHRDDKEALYAYVDKLYAEANWIEMPPLKFLEDLNNYPEFVEHVRHGTGLGNDPV